MAYKFQLGASTMSGSLTQEGDIDAQEVSGTIGKFTHLSCSANSLVVGGVTISATEIAVLDNFGDHGMVHNADAFVFYDAGTSAFRRDDFGDVMATAAGDGLEESGDKLRIKTDGPTLARGNSGLKIADNQVDTLQLKNNAVTTAIIAAAAVDRNKLHTDVAGDGLAGGGGTALSVQVSGAIKIASDKVGITGSFAGAGLGYVGGVDSIRELEVRVASQKGIGIGADQLELDIGGLQANNAGAIAHQDSFAMWDQDASVSKKVELAQLAQFQAGDGLDHQNGVLKFNPKGDGGLEINSNQARIKVRGTSLELHNDGVRVRRANDSALLEDNGLKLKTGLAGNGLSLGGGGGDQVLAVGAGHGISVGGTDVSVNLDGSTLFKSNSGLKVNTDGITANEIADNAVVTDRIQNGAVTSAKLANDITIAGSLTVNGSMTSISTTNLEVEDKMILLGSGSQGAGQSSDMGLVFRTGDNQKDHGFIYDFSSQEFAVIKESSNGDLMDAAVAGNLTIDSYAGLRADEFRGKVTGSVATPIMSIGNQNAILIPGFCYGTTNTTQLRTWTLPSNVQMRIGESVKVKAPASVHADGLKIQRDGSQTIDGEQFILLESGYAAVELVYVAADTWRVI